MDEDEPFLPLWRIAGAMALVAFAAAAIVFFVSLIGSWGVGEGPTRTQELLFRAEFVGALAAGAVLAGTALGWLRLRDPETKLIDWGITGFAAGAAVGLAGWLIMAWDILMAVGLPVELIGGLLMIVGICGVAGALAALPIRAIALFRFQHSA